MNTQEKGSVEENGEEDLSGLSAAGTISSMLKLNVRMKAERENEGEDSEDLSTNTRLSRGCRGSFSIEAVKTKPFCIVFFSRLALKSVLNNPTRTPKYVPYLYYMILWISDAQFFEVVQLLDKLDASTIGKRLTGCTSMSMFELLRH